MNSRKPPFKVSFVEKSMNNIIMFILAVQVGLSLLSMTLHILWYHTYDSLFYYLCFDYDTMESVSTDLYTDCVDDSSVYPEFGYFFTFFILYRYNHISCESNCINTLAYIIFLSRCFPFIANFGCSAQ